MSARTLRGRRALVPAFEAVLGRECEAVVVRGLVPRAARRAVLEGADATEVLYQAVPQMADVDELVSAWWAEHGYRDYMLVGPKMWAGTLKGGGVSPHCDEDEFIEGLESPAVIYGPASMSVGLTRGRSTLFVEHTHEDWFTPEGTYDGRGLTVLLASDRHPERQGRMPATQLVQAAGDAVVFATQPQPSFHAVEAPEDRKAQVFEYCLRHISLQEVPAPSAEV